MPCAVAQTAKGKEVCGLGPLPLASALSPASLWQKGPMMLFYEAQPSSGSTLWSVVEKDNDILSPFQPVSGTHRGVCFYLFHYLMKVDGAENDTNKEQLEKEIRKAISLKAACKRIRFLGLNKVRGLNKATKHSRDPRT